MPAAAFPVWRKIVANQEHDATLAARLKQVQKRIEKAALNAGRNPADITLVAVSKFHPSDAVAELVRHGQMDFGENYMQEALRKQDEIQALLNKDPARRPALRWHFIGHLQSRKVGDAIGRFALIHTVDSLKLAQNMHKNIINSTPEGRTPTPQDILIQVNIGEEAQKSGVAIDSLPELAEQVETLSGLRLLGLMCIPPFFDDAERSRPFFVKLRELRDDLNNRLGRSLPCLSMGMSMDFEAAIAEGATIVRVGTDIFGPRTQAR